jgi:peptidoglycan hydrolase-like protein with peptidoglycan-binding domain
MKKIVKLTESDLVNIVKKVLNEQLSNVIDTPEEIKQFQQILVNLGYNLGTSGTQKNGVDGYYGPKTKAAIINYQKSNNIQPTGVLDQTTQNALGSKSNNRPNYSPINTNGFKSAAVNAINSKLGQKSKVIQKPQGKTDKSVGMAWMNKASQQVRNQVKYLQSKKFEKAFTIVDDINSKVYAVNPDYSLYNVYSVVTGKDRGDEVKNVTFTDWFFENPMDNLWGAIKTFWKKDLQSAANELDKAYFNTKMWVKKNTPSGIFTADLGVGNWLKDKVMTAFAEKDYGRKFIGFRTLGGEELAVGFHGTKNPARININKDDWNQNVKSKKGNVSFGCVNFRDVDIQNLSKFISSGQYSFWLPDSNTSILKF